MGNTFAPILAKKSNVEQTNVHVLKTFVLIIYYNRINDVDIKKQSYINNFFLSFIFCPVFEPKKNAIERH